jgi:hypothetical protein
MKVEISEDGFINMLMNQNGGAVVDELNRELSKSICAILDHGGGAEITLKIKLSKLKSMNAAMRVEHDVIVKNPKEERIDQAMFLSSTNGLLIQPQEQEKFDFNKPVSAVTRLHDVNDNKK